MKNLKQQTRVLFGDQLLKRCRCLTIDPDDKILYTVNDDNEIVAVDTQNNKIYKLCSLDEDAKPLAIEYIFEDRLLCIAMTNGKLLTYNSLDNSVNLVGVLSDELHSMAFSLDQDLVVFLTSTKLILMNKYFDVLAEKSAFPQEFGASQPIDVGWGSVKTQFQGSEGKYKPTLDKTELCQKLEVDQTSRISWRGDGQYFATSALDPRTRSRILRIWNREAELQFTSERLDGLEELISWRPSGNLIASSQKLPNKHQIVFFEKNGLRHGEFVLPADLKLERLAWSCDSTILLLLASELSETDSKQILSLWTSSNYHWYEKQVLVFKDKHVLEVMWDQNESSLLHVIFEDEYVQYRWTWTVDFCGPIVSVLDGNKINVSDFEKSVVPPPLCNFQLEFKKKVCQMCLSRSGEIAIIFCDETILYSNEITKSIESSDFKPLNGILAVTNLILNGKKLFGLLASENILSDELILVDLEAANLNLQRIANLNEKITAITCRDQILLAATKSQKLLKYDIDSGTVSFWNDVFQTPVSYSKSCYHLDLCKINSRLCAVALTKCSTLYLDNHVLCKNMCNSFKVYDDRFMIFTTNNNFLHCVKLDCLKFNENDLNESIRAIELGAQIVTVASVDAKVILQMPRGNLEAIYPRPLLLDVVMRNLNQLQFDVAFQLLRKHRINLNFIVDYDVELFLQNMDIFIKQISEINIQWICLFLYELENEDVISKLYSSEFVVNKKYNFGENDNKVDVICDKLRNVMSNLDPLSYLHPILLTFTKKTVPQVGDALRMIKSVESTKTRDEAIRFINYSIDTNKLCDEALGTYDFDIFIIIAEKSQKDPKEYMNLIEELKSVASFNYRCYKIDLHLKRLRQALNNLFKCDLEVHFSEALELIVSNNLYKDAIKIIELDTKIKEEYKNRIWKSFGDYLLSKKYYEEAAIAFKRCQDYESALKVYHLNGNWNEAIFVAKKCTALEHKLPEIYKKLADYLESRGNHVEAAHLYECYLCNKKEALNVLIRGHVWEQFYRLAAEVDEKEFEGYFLEELKNHFETNLEIINSSCEKINNYAQRLSIVRENKMNKYHLDEIYDVNDSKSDVFSDTSSLVDGKSASQQSVASLATRKSRSLNRSLKKQERKKYALREGSRDEDIQLIFAINELVTSADDMQKENSVLIKVLYDFKCFDEAKTLQTQFDNLFQVIKLKIKQIWHDCDLDSDVCEKKLIGNKMMCKLFTSDYNLRSMPIRKEVHWKFALL